MSDYLTDEEQLARLKSWWNDNGLVLVSAVVLSVAGVAGYRWYDESRLADIAQASDLYAEYLQAEGDARNDIAQTINSELAESSYSTLVLLRAAGADVEAEDYAAAEVNLRLALGNAPDGLADLARLRLARVLQQLDRSEDALVVLGAVRGDGFRPQVAELKGDIHQSRGEQALAHEAYNAALEGLSDGLQRPLLELKVADTVDTAVEEDTTNDVAKADTTAGQVNPEAGADPAGAQHQGSTDPDSAGQLRADPGTASADGAGEISDDDVDG